MILKRSLGQLGQLMLDPFDNVIPIMNAITIGTPPIRGAGTRCAVCTEFRSFSRLRRSRLRPYKTITNPVHSSEIVKVTDSIIKVETVTKSALPKKNTMGNYCYFTLHASKEYTNRYLVYINSYLVSFIVSPKKIEEKSDATFNGARRPDVEPEFVPSEGPYRNYRFHCN